MSLSVVLKLWQVLYLGSLRREGLVLCFDQVSWVILIRMGVWRMFENTALIQSPNAPTHHHHWGVINGAPTPWQLWEGWSDFFVGQGLLSILSSWVSHLHYLAVSVVMFLFTFALQGIILMSTTNKPYPTLLSLSFLGFFLVYLSEQRLRDTTFLPLASHSLPKLLFPGQHGEPIAGLPQRNSFV
jgi:hypothetical protein